MRFAIVNTLSLCFGAFFLTLELGWKLALGITLLVFFHKQVERF